MAPKPASKQTSAAASKIKNKILNTSSFFRVSLKTNNKALALALEAQKERSRLLEKEIVYLHKQVEALCFELATKKYKHRKLLLILKNLHSNTLQHLNMAADLFSDSDLPKLPEEDEALYAYINKDNLVVGSLTDQAPQQPENSRALQKVTVDLPEEDICGNDFSIHNRPQNSTDMFSDVEEKQIRLSAQTGTAFPSSTLRDEVERLSVMFSQSGSDIKSVLCLQRKNPEEEEESKPSRDDRHVPSSSVVDTETEHGNKQEKTVLLNTTMEMTLTNTNEIVTVETKAKKTGCSGKCNKRKEQVCGPGEAESPHVKNSTDCLLSDLQTDNHALEDIRDSEVFEPQSPKTQCLSAISSRVPKLNKSEGGSHQKRKKDKVKSHDQAMSKTVSCDIVSPDLHDYLMDPRIKFSKACESVMSLPEKDIAEGARSKITCRRSRTKGRRLSSVTGKIFFTLPPPLHESKSSPSKLEQICNEVEEEHAGSEPQTATNSWGSHKSMYRETFVISVASSSTSTDKALPTVGTVEQSLIPSPASSNYKVQEQSTVLDTGINQQHSESNPHGHRPFACQDVLSSNGSYDVLLLDQGCTSGTQKPKRVETSRSSKKKAVHREEWVDHLNERKKGKKGSLSDKGFRSDDVTNYLGDSLDGPGRSKQQLDDLQVVDSPVYTDKDGQARHLYHSKPTESESRLEWNPEWCRNASKHLSNLEPRNVRETFVVYRHKTQDRISQKNTRMSDVSCAYSNMMDTNDEALHESLGGLLMDEMPPWLAADVSTVDTEVGSLLATPKRDTSHSTAVLEESAAVTTEASPAGRVLTSLTNTIATPESENRGQRGRTRRQHGVVSYKEPSLNIKMRRGDKFTESTFLSSPVFKDGKMKKKKQKKTLSNSKLERSILESYVKMEARKLKRDVEALIGDYIGQKLKEKSFDPKGKGTSTMLDELVHYDLAISVALWWLDKKEGQDVLDKNIIGATSSPGTVQYPNHLEREAMILSSFAGIIMNSLPVEGILALYKCKPAASYQQSKGTIVYPLTLSYHPFAMLSSYKAVQHSKKHSLRLKRWLSERVKTSASPGRVTAQSSSSSSSSHSFLSESDDCHDEKAEYYEGSQESLQD